MTAGKSQLLRGKKALVVGLLNKHSIAAQITNALVKNGAEVVVSSSKELKPGQAHQMCGLVDNVDALHAATCDVESDASIEHLMETFGSITNGKLDILVHSVAFAPRPTFRNDGFLNASRDDWNQAMNVSAYSLIALTRAALPLLQNTPQEQEEKTKSIMALTYAGSTKIMPGYNVMGPAKAALEATSRQLAYDLGPKGIRVNCLSPGPMNTVSARGVPGISQMRKFAEQNTPLRRNSSGEDIGNLAAFLASDMSSSITGQTLYVDGGLSSLLPFQSTGSTE